MYRPGTVRRAARRAQPSADVRAALAAAGATAPDAAPATRQQRRLASRRRVKDIALIELATGRELIPDLTDGFVATVARHVRDNQSRRGLEAALAAKAKTEQALAAVNTALDAIPDAASATACHNPTTKPNDESSHDDNAKQAAPPEPDEPDPVRPV